MPRKLAAVLVAVCTTLFPVMSRAESQVRIVRLSYVYGNVQIDRGEGRGFERALLNLPLMGGDRLLTSGSARAEIEFEKGSTIRMMPGTGMAFTDLSRRDSGQPSTSMVLHEGTAYFNLHRKDGREFGVVVGGHKIRLPKSARFRLQVRGTEAKLAVFKGKLEVAGNTSGEWVAVGKKETLTLDLDDASRNFLTAGISPLLLYDDWDKEIEAYRDNNAPIHSVVFGYRTRNRVFNGYCSRGYLYNDPIQGYSWCWDPGQGYWQADGSRAQCRPRGYNPQPPPASGGGTSAPTVGHGPRPGGGPNPRGPGGRQPVFDTSEPNRPSTGFSGGGYGNSGSYDAGSRVAPSSVGSGASAGGSSSRNSSSPGSMGRMDSGSHSSGGNDRGSQRVNNPR